MADSDLSLSKEKRIKSLQHDIEVRDAKIADLCTQLEQFTCEIKVKKQLVTEKEMINQKLQMQFAMMNQEHQRDTEEVNLKQREIERLTKANKELKEELQCYRERDMDRVMKSTSEVDGQLSSTTSRPRKLSKTELKYLRKSKETLDHTVLIKEAVGDERMIENDYKMLQTVMAYLISLCKADDESLTKLCSDHPQHQKWDNSIMVEVKSLEAGIMNLQQKLVESKRECTRLRMELAKVEHQVLGHESELLKGRLAQLDQNHSTSQPLQMATPTWHQEARQFHLSLHNNIS